MPPMAKGRPRNIVRKDGAYEVILNVGGRDHSLRTDNVAESLVTFQPLKLGGKGILTVKKGEKKFQKVFYPFGIRKLMFNKTYRLIFQKQVDQVLT